MRVMRGMRFEPACACAQNAPKSMSRDELMSSLAERLLLPLLLLLLVNGARVGEVERCGSAVGVHGMVGCGTTSHAAHAYK